MILFYFSDSLWKINQFLCPSYAPGDEIKFTLKIFYVLEISNSILWSYIYFKAFSTFRFTSMSGKDPETQAEQRIGKERVIHTMRSHTP